MNIDRVTITGADDSVEPRDLIDLQVRFPFVEWGILLSARQEGSPRFPSYGWLQRLKEARAQSLNFELPLSGHLCGRWVRDLTIGHNTFRAERADVADMFDRVQLNFHGEPHSVDPYGLQRALREWEREQYVFQYDAVNDGLMSVARAGGVDAVPLFDRSGGTGVEPNAWPTPIPGLYCGYAGGLDPARLVPQLDRIAVALKGRGTAIWIDTETKVRSNDNARLDLERVFQFLWTAEQYMKAVRL